MYCSVRLFSVNFVNVLELCPEWDFSVGESLRVGCEFDGPVGGIFAFCAQDLQTGLICKGFSKLATASFVKPEYDEPVLSSKPKIVFDSLPLLTYFVAAVWYTVF